MYICPSLSSLALTRLTKNGEGVKLEELDQETRRVGLSLLSSEGVALAHHSRAHCLPG